MKILITLLFIAPLVGCATQAEMRSQAPVLEISSNLSSKVVASCIFDKWEGSGLFGLSMPVNMRQTKTGLTVFVRDFHNRTTLIADIDDLSVGSKTVLYENFGLGVTPFIEAVKTCQK